MRRSFRPTWAARRFVRDAHQSASRFHFPVKRRQAMLVAVLLLAAVGALVAPDNLADGEYVARVRVALEGETETVDFPFAMADELGEPREVVAPFRDGYIHVAGHDAYPNELEGRIEYRLRVVDATGEPLDLEYSAASSRISGPGYSQDLPPVDRDGDQLVFTMRIPYEAHTALGLLFAVAALWLTELVPLAAAALLIPVVVVVGGVTDTGTVLEPFFHPIIVLFLAGFLLAEGMHRSGADRRLALNVLRRASLEPAYLMLTMMVVTAFFSMWMSNTASAAIILPIAVAILDRIPRQVVGTGYRRALLLGVAYAATIGGIGSAIGTPANYLALTFLGDFAGQEMNFVDWFPFGVPMVIVMLPLIWLVLIFSFGARFKLVDPHLSHEVYRQELDKMGSPSSQERQVLIVFAGVMVLWLLQGWHGIHPAIVALGGALVLFFTEVIVRDDLKRINWNALLTFGGGLSIGSILVLTGVSDYLALQLTVLADQPPYLVLFAVAALTLVTGAFISNTACAAMLIPLAIPLARVLQMDPRLLVAIVAISSSIDFAMVIGTPPTMMAYATGEFDTSQIFRRGVVLDAVGILVLVFVVTLVWQALGVVAF